MNAMRKRCPQHGAGAAKDDIEKGGLSNTRPRLTQLCNQHRFGLQSRPPSGVVVSAAIPFRFAASGAV